MALIAKMFAQTPEESKDTDGNVIQVRYRLTAVFSNDPDNPNTKWAKWTPSGQVDLWVNNPDAFGAIKDQTEYLVRIEEV